MNKTLFSIFISLLAAALVFTSCEPSVLAAEKEPDYKLEMDSYEDDNDFFTENTIKMGSKYRQTHSICDENDTAADEDFIRLNAVSGKYYKIQTYSAEGDTLDTVLKVFNANGTEQATNDSNGNSTLAMIDWRKCTTTATYIIKVTATETGYYGIDVEEFSGVMITTLPYSETFETVSVSPWTDWVKDSFVTNTGSGAIRTPTIGDSEETSITMMVDITGTAKNLTFSWRVGSEENKDYFIFYLDGEEVEKISGTTSWAQVTASLPVGKHLIIWEYNKNDSKASTPYDCGWLDDISIQ